MARFTFKLPDIGEGISEAEIVAWHVAVGDRIEEDQQIADMMTDKATVEMESPVSGVVVELAGEVGDQVSIGAALVVIETEGDVSAEEAPALAPVTDEVKAAPPSPAQEETAEQYEAENPGVEDVQPAPLPLAGGTGEGPEKNRQPGDRAAPPPAPAASGRGKRTPPPRPPSPRPPSARARRTSASTSPR
nr:biotin/lipoyl-containing protein [Sphingomonas aliaeris]